MEYSDEEYEIIKEEIKESWKGFYMDVVSL